MVDIYVALIIAKRKTIDNVILKYKQAVLDALEALGLDGYGEEIES